MRWPDRWICADAIELVFRPERAAGERLGRGGGIFLRGCEHELNGMKKTECRGLQSIVSREHGHFIEIADKKLAALNLQERFAKSQCDRCLKNALLRAGAQIAENNLGNIRCFTGMGAVSQQAGEKFTFEFLDAGGGQIVECDCDILERNRVERRRRRNIGPDSGDRFADFSMPANELVELLRRNPQQLDRDLRKCGEPKIQRAFVRRSERATGGESHRQAQVAFGQRSEILGKQLLLDKF